MRAVIFLLKRYIFPHRGSLLTLALWVSVAGVALGIMQLMLVLSVMSGFIDLFQTNYTRISSELVVIPKQKKDPNFETALTALEGLESVTPFGLGQAMVIHNGVGGVTLEGIEVQSSQKVTPWKEIWLDEPDWKEQSKDDYWIWLGVQLAQKLGVKPGDMVDVLIPSSRGRRIIPFRVTAITKFGIYDHDMRYARIDLNVLKEIFRTHHVEPMYKTKVVSGVPLETVALEVQSSFDGAETRLWSQVHENIFRAVQHQKGLLFLILEIIVALAAVNVVNLLMMSSYHRRRDVAILRAMGMKLRWVLGFFVAQGAAVGFVGILLGVALGYVLCFFVEKFQPEILSEKIYNVSRLPIQVHFSDVLLVCVAGFILCVVFSLIPAVGAAIARPATTLRDE